MGGDESILSKTMKTAVATSVFGAAVGTTRAIWADQPMGRPARNISFIQNTMRQVGRHSFLFGGGSSAFVLAEHASASMRGKHDAWNTVAGCCAGASVLGCYANSFKVGVAGALFLSIGVTSLTYLTKIGTGDKRNRRKIYPYPPVPTQD